VLLWDWGFRNARGSLCAHLHTGGGLHTSQVALPLPSQTFLSPGPHPPPGCLPCAPVSSAPVLSCRSLSILPLGRLRPLTPDRGNYLTAPCPAPAPPSSDSSPPSQPWPAPRPPCGEKTPPPTSTLQDSNQPFCNPSLTQTPQPQVWGEGETGPWASDFWGQKMLLGGKGEKDHWFCGAEHR
jgi:hypothetical protein